MALKPKVFIIGISGLVGYALGLGLRKNFLVTGASFRNQVWIPGSQIFPVTLKSADVLEALIRVQNPDFIISAAGTGDRREVEAQPKVSDMVNIMLPVSSAILASRLRAKFLNVGCAEVFGGEKGMYTEDDTEFTLTDPVGKQKIAAHSYIRAQTLESTTLRFGRVIGVGHPFRRSFFDRFRATAAEKTTYDASRNKTRSYISCRSVVQAVEQVLMGESPPRHRTFHVGGANMTEHELISTWYKLMGADPRLVAVLQDSKHNLSLDSTTMQKNYPGWKAESKQELLLSMLEELTPAVGNHRWQKTVAGL